MMVLQMIVKVLFSVGFVIVLIGYCDDGENVWFDYVEIILVDGGIVQCIEVEGMIFNNYIVFDMWYGFGGKMI